MARRTITRTVGTDRHETRSYLDLQGDSLLAHVAKHVLDPDEQWDCILGLDIPGRPKQVRQAMTLLVAGHQLENVLAWAAATHGGSAWSVFWYLLCEPELEYFAKLSPEEAAPTLGTLKAHAAAEYFAGSVDANDVPREIVQGVIETGRLRPFVEIAERREEVAKQLAQAPVPVQIRKWVKHARSTFEARAWRFLITRESKEAHARDVLQAALGKNAAELTQAYLREGERAAAGAGIKPRHCVFRRALLPYAEAYVDDRGIAVVIGGTSSKSALQQFSIFRPLAGRGAREKARIGRQFTAFLAAGASVDKAAPKAFLETFDRADGDVVEALFNRRQWMGD